MYRTCSTLFIACLLLITVRSTAQLKWENVDSLFQPLPSSVHVYKTIDSLDGKPNIAYYMIANLKDKQLLFTTDTTYKRRLTPTQFYEKNNRPLLVVNSSFFSFATDQNLNLVIKNGKILGYNIHSIAGRGRDTLTYRHPFGSALGISNKRKADIAWLYTDSTHNYAYAYQQPVGLIKDSLSDAGIAYKQRAISKGKKWKMQTAVGGGPVLLQDGEIKITNNEEWRFAGKAIDDRHPRTAMGYTRDNHLIILLVEGRHEGKAEGASLTQEARILKDLGCVEALNLDGGGSSCMLINGKETIQPSEKGVQRPLPAVFIIHSR